MSAYPEKDCGYCGGIGFISSFQQTQYSILCPVCNGNGKILDLEKIYSEILAKLIIKKKVDELVRRKYKYNFRAYQKT